MKFFDLDLYTLSLQFFLGCNSILHHLAQTPPRRIIRFLRAEFRLRHASCFVRRQPFGHSLGGGALAMEAEHEDHENFLGDISLWIRTFDPVCLSKLCNAMSLFCSPLVPGLRSCSCRPNGLRTTASPSSTHLRHLHSHLWDSSPALFSSLRDVSCLPIASEHSGSWYVNNILN